MGCQTAVNAGRRGLRQETCRRRFEETMITCQDNAPAISTVYISADEWPDFVATINGINDSRKLAAQEQADLEALAAWNATK